jgi:hypothetical protein
MRYKYKHFRDLSQEIIYLAIREHLTALIYNLNLLAVIVILVYRSFYK